MTETAFLQDLALLTAVAGGISILFAKLRWPKVIGYLVAGILLSRHVWGVSLLADESSIQTIAQLGVIFLMFTMGLDFSMSQMKKIKHVTLPTAIFDATIMMWLGYTIGRSVLGWSSIASLFLGAAICDSSTTLLAKIIDEMNWSKRPFVKYVIGTSICEDIMCVGIIALITGFASGNGMSLEAVGLSLGGLLVFFIATFIFGLLIVPRLIASVDKYKDDETLLLTILGCCFLVTFIAYKLDFSLALGAFLVGVLSSNSPQRHKLKTITDPLRTLFAAVFFVSIGLLVNPAICLQNGHWILLVSMLVIAGKALNCFLGALITGETVKTAMQMGMGLAQIGEFAFMVAILYMSLTSDTTKPIFQIVIGVSLLTTLLNPLFLRLSDKCGTWVEENIPNKIKEKLASYRLIIAKFRATKETDANRAVIRRSITELVLIAILEFAVAIAFSMLNNIDWSNYSKFLNEYKRIISALLVNLFILSMLPPVIAVSKIIAHSFGEIITGKSETKWQQTFENIVQFTIRVSVVALFFLEAVMININLAPEGIVARFIVLFAGIITAILGWRFFLRAGHTAADNFRMAIASDEHLQMLSREVTITLPPVNIISRIEITGDSTAIGESVISLNIRSTTGASIIGIERNGESLNSIYANVHFQKGDIVIATGNEQQIAALQILMGKKAEGK